MLDPPKVGDTYILKKSKDNNISCKIIHSDNETVLVDMTEILQERQLHDTQYFNDTFKKAN